MPNSFRIGEFNIQPPLLTVSGPAATVRLESKVMLVLVCLAEHGDQVVPKERLMRAVWPDTFVTDDVLTRAISELRRVFGDDVKNPRFIQTIPRSGYRLIAPVSFTGPNDNAAATAPAGSPERPQAMHDDIAARAESDRVRADSRRLPRSWMGGVAALAAVAAVLLAGMVAQRMSDPRPAFVVRSAQVTSLGQVAWPAIDVDYYPAIATDGARVYFTYLRGTRHAIGQSSIGGGDVLDIQTPFDHALLVNLSPDGSRLLVRDFDQTQLDGSLWVIPAIGGAPLRLGAVEAHDGAWTPDGRRIVFARREELYVAESDGSKPRKLATTPGRAFWLRWSPDGARLRFTVVSPRGDTRSLWEVSADGDGLRPLPVGRREHDADCCGEWSRDGRQFFFRRFRDEKMDMRMDIWLLRERERLFGATVPEVARLTTGPLHFPAGVPTQDGRRLLVIGGQGRAENLRFDPGTRAFFPYDSAGGPAGWFAFSRDREWMAYARYPEGILWRSRVDGSERLQLRPSPMQLAPRWSPDGTRIAFVEGSVGGHWKIYVIGANGGEPQLMHEEERPQSDPDWSPDGTSLMFGRPPEYVAEPTVPKAIHLFNLRTRELSTLPGSEGLFGSRWSPSGRYVAAVTLDQTKLLLFDFNTRTWTELGQFKTVHNASWSHDERFLYFEVVHESSIYRMRMRDRALERVVGFDAAWKSAYGGCVFQGLAPDDALLVSCSRYDTDIYALDWERR